MGMVCASVQSSIDLISLTTEPCHGTKCTWFKNNHCAAIAETADEYRRHYIAGELPALPSKQFRFVIY